MAGAGVGLALAGMAVGWWGGKGAVTEKKGRQAPDGMDAGRRLWAKHGRLPK